MGETLEPWTPLEREAFGINDLDRFIRETDKALADPLDRLMAADEDDIVLSWATPEPIVKPGPRVWEQTETGFIQTGSITADKIWVSPILGVDRMP